MPIYAFQCKACGHKFEELTSIAKQAEVACPKCGGEVARVYEGRCAFGGSAKGSGHSCSGSCSCCSGCHHD